MRLAQQWYVHTEVLAIQCPFITPLTNSGKNILEPRHHGSPIFLEGLAKPLKGGQLLAVRFNHEIKHRPATRTLQENPTTVITPRFTIIPKICFAGLHGVDGQIIFSPGNRFLVSAIPEHRFLFPRCLSYHHRRSWIQISERTFPSRKKHGLCFNTKTIGLIKMTHYRFLLFAITETITAAPLSNY